MAAAQLRPGPPPLRAGPRAPARARSGERPSGPRPVLLNHPWFAVRLHRLACSLLPAESRALGGGREGQGFRAPRTLARLAWGGDAVRSECALGDGGPAGGRAQSECRRFKESGDKDGGGGFLGGGAAEESGRVRIGWKAMGTWGRQAGTLDTHSPESVFTGAAPIDSRRLRWCRGSFRHQQAGTPRRRDARTPAFAHESPL
ncbi:uncharacterized protein [Castor canadensis]|uniref:Uncharacterized protein n=1 Tax=Castor canadensis TaxID=51338 RepID=A0AC58L8G8_CASCN